MSEDKDKMVISQEWADWWELASEELPDQVTADEIATVFSLFLDIYDIKSYDVANHVFKVLYYHMEQDVMGPNRTLH